MKAPYDAIGGEPAVRRLVDRFYDYMDSLPEAAHIRQMHAKSLRVSRDKLFLFLSGWLGGPALYVEKYGPPMLRRRHLPFSIGLRERDEWMECMIKALSDVVQDEALRRQLEQSFLSTADHMRNQPEYDADDALRLFPGGFRQGRSS